MFCALYIPDFPAAAVIRAEPDLRAHAVAVLEGTPPLLRVSAMNEAARCLGVEPGMMKIEAEALPDLALRRRSPTAEAAAEDALLDCAHGFSPRVEPLAPDTVLLDAAGLERLFGPPAKLASEIAARAAALGLEPNLAIASNREAAIHAARGFTGTTIIPPGQEAKHLAELAIDVLFSGPDASGSSPQRRGDAETDKAQKPNGRKSVSKPREYREAPNFDNLKRETSKLETSLPDAPFFIGTLDRWGVHNLRGFAALPTVAVAERLGQEGVRLQKMARGEGSCDLIPAEPPLRFVESMELEHAVDLLEPLAFILARLLEQLCARLSARALATNELRLALTLDSAVRDEETEHPPQRHRVTEDDKSKDESSSVSLCLCGGNFARTLRLPTPMLDPRLFLKLLQLDLKQHPPQAPVLKVELAAEPVRPQVAQHGLFQAAAPEPEKLHLMLARLAAIVGKDNAGSPELLDTHRRDAFAMKSFDAGNQNPPQRHRGTEKKLSDCHSEAKRSAAEESAFQFGSSAVRQFGNSSPRLRDSAVSTAIRILRPPLPAQVTVRDHQPVRVACEGDGSRAPIAGDIAWASGPWRSSGDWWAQTAAPNREASETRYTREEWDIAIATAGGDVLCRLVHDLEEGTWLLEGIYD